MALASYRIVDPIQSLLNRSGKLTPYWRDKLSHACSGKTE